MFLANMDEAERTEESAEDITAALTAPRPRKATHCPKEQSDEDKLLVEVHT